MFDLNRISMGAKGLKQVVGDEKDDDKRGDARVEMPEVEDDDVTPFSSAVGRRGSVAKPEDDFRFVFLQYLRELFFQPEMFSLQSRIRILR